MTRLTACLAFFLILLSGCVTVPPPPPPGCSIAAFPLTRAAADIKQRQLSLLTRSPAKPIASFTDLLKSHRQVSLTAAHGVTNALLLSGGSQHGAFGGGFLAGLKQSGHFLDYDVVTGISTGAIQSPFAFLANAKEPDDRTYQAFMLNSKGIGTGQSNLTDLAIAYLIDRESDLIHKRSLGFAGVIVSGSLETFDPMRKLALGLISPKTLMAIHNRQTGRLLLVGVTSLDDANTYALDLTALADDAALHPQNTAADQQCFVDAILASAAVPPGILPVTLTTYLVHTDGTPGRPEVGHFIDGGSRYAVFFDQLAMNKDPARSANVDVIVNGLLHLDKWMDPITKEEVKKYSALDILMRSSDILESQARETSVQSAEDAAEGGQFRIAYMLRDESDDHRYSPVPDPSGLRPPTCRTWALYDQERFHPLEFYPNYMRCILDYGRDRGSRGLWNDIKSK